MQVWLEHDSDWIYPDGPTGNLHDVYFNQFVPSFPLPHSVTNFVFNHSLGPDMKYCGGVVLNEPVFHVNYEGCFRPSSMQNVHFLRPRDVSLLGDENTKE